MIGKNLKKYLNCHKYYFVPLGILSIFVVIAFTACFSGITNVLKDFFNKAGEIAKELADTTSEIAKAGLAGLKAGVEEAVRAYNDSKNN